MYSLSVAVLLVAVAVANAGGIYGHVGLGAPVDTAAVVAGPSGKIVRSGLAVAHAAPIVHHAAPLAIAHASPLAYGAYGAYGAHVAPLAYAHGAHLGYAGSGLEGQWIPDINEKLYDDGSYKPHVYGY